MRQQRLREGDKANHNRAEGQPTVVWKSRRHPKTLAGASRGTKMTESTRTFQLKFRIQGQKTLISVPALPLMPSFPASQNCVLVCILDLESTQPHGASVNTTNGKDHSGLQSPAPEHLPSGSRSALDPSSNLRRARVPGGEREVDQETSKTENEVTSVTEY